MNYGRGLGPNGFPTKEQILDPYHYPREIVGECWIFQGAKGQNGYGLKEIYGKMYGVHRIVAYVFHGLDLSDSEQWALHKNICTNRACFNPEHIYIGNASANAADAFQKGTKVYFRKNLPPKTHCIKGHELIGDNLYLQGNKRKCRTCRNITSQKWNQKIKELNKNRRKSNDSK